MSHEGDQGRELLIAGVLHSVALREADGPGGQFPVSLTVDDGVECQAEVVLTTEAIHSIRRFLARYDCPCTPEAPAHVCGEGGYADE